MIRPATADDIRQMKWETRTVDHHAWAEHCREIVREVRARYGTPATPTSGLVSDEEAG